MNTAEIIILVLIGITLLMTAYHHGEEKPPYNIWLTLVSSVLNFAILWWAGLFH